VVISWYDVLLLLLLLLLSYCCCCCFLTAAAGCSTKLIGCQFFAAGWGPGNAVGENPGEVLSCRYADLPVIYNKVTPSTTN
jgi:hypothetical protein